MVGQIIYLTTLFLIVVTIIWAYKAGALIFNNVGQSISVDYEIMGEHGIPIISLTSSHGTKYNFLVDTGANANYLNRSILTEFSESEQVVLTTESYYGVDGTDYASTSHKLRFTHRNSKLVDTYIAGNMDGVFNKYKNTIGKELHGILGTSFLKHHGMSLDINRMIVWKRL